ncbi:MAG: response regulator transcription factor [Bacteroidetes bacterium]|nr:response regulator transcription factor [Bacteroidota bacterium]
MKKRIIIFDDNRNRREGLEMLINLSENLVCAGTYSDCRDVLDHIAQTNPNVVLMDIDMPYVNGIEGVKQIRSRYPDLKILMQTIFEDDDKIFDSICAGADGYILKKASLADLVDAIEVVCEGGAPMTPSIARKVLALMQQKNKKNNTEQFHLTQREQEILALLVEGFSYKMIADRCQITRPTVNTHISHIFEKLHVNSGTEAVAKAIHNKIV